MSFSRYDRWYSDWCWAEEPESTYNENKAYISFSAEDMEDAYNAGTNYFERTKKEWDHLEQKCDALENLLAANVRVIKQEILREQALVKDNDKDTSPAEPVSA